MVESRQSDATSFPVRGTALTERDLLSLGGILFAQGRGGNPGLGDTAAGIILITWCLAGCRVTGGRLSQRRGLGGFRPGAGGEAVKSRMRIGCPARFGCAAEFVLAVSSGRAVRSGRTGGHRRRPVPARYIPCRSASHPPRPSPPGPRRRRPPPRRGAGPPVRPAGRPRSPTRPPG